MYTTSQISLSQLRPEAKESKQGVVCALGIGSAVCMETPLAGKGKQMANVCTYVLNKIEAFLGRREFQRTKGTQPPVKKT